MPTDEQLIQEINNGSQAAMEVLTKRYYKQIYAYIYRKTSNSHMAYDLTQDVFIKMIRNISTYANGGSFSSWLYTIAVNICRDYYRSAAYRRTAATSVFEDHASQLTSNAEGIAYIFENKETRKQLKEAIGQLPETQSEAILLKYYHDLKIREIASVTGANENTVKARLRQGLGKLKTMLGRDRHEQKESN
ncbi:RNA polymerase subunit sigma [Paenibacillus sp. MY03]|uniref:RNA polymerase sigma factor n=1 Tax=Paenibacillus sp. MY03 TaxID=302980 RepID=UPI000B3C181D|nr:RNA polymerase sigma factor [Paenibacillus sp. MY03]OUS78569.1 RNA polymerase subunit sigma [Paenibacillus sp. MY03]